MCPDVDGGAWSLNFSVLPHREDATLELFYSSNFDIVSLAVAVNNHKLGIVSSWAQDCTIRDLGKWFD